MHLKTDTASMQAHMSAVPVIRKPRNSFSVAEKHVTTMGFDNLYPLYWKYIYPGDTLSIKHQLLARLETQVLPLFDDLYFDLHAWFVPMRLLHPMYKSSGGLASWAAYQFNAQDDSGPSQDNSAVVAPYLDITDPPLEMPAKSIYDYFGFPVTSNATYSYAGKINSYLPRAYNLIWDHNYRDENLQNPVLTPGSFTSLFDTPAQCTLLPRGKRHDRFTGCLPFQQKGTAVTIPTGGQAPLLGFGFEGTAGSSANAVYQSDGTTMPVGTPGGGTANAWIKTSTTGTINATNHPLMFANIAGAIAPTLNAFRTSFAVQHLLEADARGGTRDVESLLQRWGVTVPDFRLQRPEFLGSQTFTFDGHIVPQTSETATTPQGNLTQFSQALSGMPMTHSFVEHGIYMLLVSCRSNLTYQQGLLKELFYSTRLDWYQPEFAHLGEVAVNNQEIYFQYDDASNQNLLPFGYQEYGYELRYSMNRVSGEMRSTFAESRDSQHMADDYSSLPTLSAAWIQSQTPIGRSVVVNPADFDPISINFLTSGKITRVLPMFSIPGLTRL